MKAPRILDRYLFGELLIPFALNLLFFTFVFLMAKILDLTNLIVNYRIGLGTVLLMLLYTMPTFLEFVIPMAVMMAVLLSFMRFSSDNEIIALKAGGVSLYRVMAPVLCFCLLGALATLWITVYAAAWGRTALRELTQRILTSNLDIGLKERTFNDNFKDVMFYVTEIDTRTKGLRDVFIEDRRDPARVITVVAPEGTLFRQADEAAYLLRLTRGTVNQVNSETLQVQSTRFQTYDVPLDLEKGVGDAGRGLRKKDRDLDLEELRELIRTTAAEKGSAYYSALLRWHRKFSIPFACLALGVLAVPLGIQSRTARRPLGLGAALLFFLLYYVLLSAAVVFGEAGLYPPLLGVWVPNLVTGASGGYLMLQAARERSVLPAALGRWLAGLRTPAARRRG
jgi:lipopolysaccharide export system permease protein